MCTGYPRRDGSERRRIRGVSSLTNGWSRSLARPEDRHNHPMALVRLTTDSATRAVAGLVGPLAGLAILLAFYEPASDIWLGFAIGSVVFFLFSAVFFLFVGRHLQRTGAVGKARAPAPRQATFESTGQLVVRGTSRVFLVDALILGLALASRTSMLLGFGFGSAIVVLIWAGVLTRWERVHGTRLYHRRGPRWRLDGSVSFALPVDRGEGEGLGEGQFR